MSLIDALNWRYATKRMNGRKIPRQTLDRILESARLAPSSYGLQPYSILVVESPQLREALMQGAVNQPQARECSHLLVFATWEPVRERHVDEFIKHTAGERGMDPADLEAYSNTVKDAVSGLPTPEAKFHWAAKQAYLALGVLVSAAAVERVDATPMEGFDPAALDDILGLKDRQLRSVVLVALGYRDADNDWLAGMKKVRWPKERFLIPMG